VRKITPAEGGLGGAGRQGIIFGVTPMWDFVRPFCRGGGDKLKKPYLLREKFGGGGGEKHTEKSPLKPPGGGPPTGAK